MPWRCKGHVLQKWDRDKGRWVKNSSQPKEKTVAACQRMKRALYANVPEGRHE